MEAMLKQQISGAMNPELLEYILCPACRGDLYPVDEKDNDLISGTLACRDCQHRYDIVRGVPILLADIVDDEAFTARNFGEQWEFFKQQDTISDAFENSLFEHFLIPVGTDPIQDSVVLEAGCGYGRHLQQAKKHGARLAIGFDISSAAFIAKANGHDVVIGDIMAPPFKSCFDVVCTFGVMQHVSDPDKGLSNLYTILKPDGLFHHSVYSRENNWVLAKILTPVREKVLRHLPRRMKYGFSCLMAALSWVFFGLFYSPFNLHDSSRNWARRHLFYYEFMALFLHQLGYRAWILQIYDQINAPLAEYFTKDTVEGWLKELVVNKSYAVHRNKTTWNFGGWKTPVK